jgi:hypothetical protein
MKHTCHAIGCTTPVPPRMFMCASHWRMVPKPLQDLVWHYYRSGQEVDKRPSLDYVITTHVARNVVASREGKSIANLSGKVVYAQPE